MKIWLIHALAVTIVSAGFNSVFAASAGQSKVFIPEPLLFDMTLSLGTPRGQIETNAIFRFPINSPDSDILWVPEVEGTVWDGVGFEVEVELKGTRNVGWSVAGQVTFGTGLEDHFIHGTQVRLERDREENATELVALYIPGFRFNSTWSALIMMGARVPFEEASNTKFLFNAALFAEPHDRVVLGVETNYRANNLRSELWSIIPQIHLVLTDNFSVQAGTSLSLRQESDKAEALVRVIYGF